MTTTPERPAYLIRKRGAYYRPNAQGYTTSVSEAGRYTLADAVRHSHPNGPDGPRDGITYVHEDEVTGGTTTPETLPDLKTCPFCGEGLVISRSRLAAHRQHSECLLKANAVDIDNPDQVAAWNRRASNSPAPAMDGLLEAVRAADTFFRVAMPKMNVGASALDAEAIAAWNAAEIAVSKALAALAAYEEIQK